MLRSKKTAKKTEVVNILSKTLFPRHNIKKTVKH